MFNWTNISLANGPTEESVRKELQDIEEAEKKEGRTTIYATSPSGFLRIGLQLEDLQ